MNRFLILSFVGILASNCGESNKDSKSESTPEKCSPAYLETYNKLDLLTYEIEMKRTACQGQQQQTPQQDNYGSDDCDNYADFVNTKVDELNPLLADFKAKFNKEKVCLSDGEAPETLYFEKEVERFTKSLVKVPN